MAIIDQKKREELRNRADYFTCTKLDEVPEDEAKLLLEKARKARPDLYK